jgi:hypothetical protein
MYGISQCYKPMDNNINHNHPYKHGIKPQNLVTLYEETTPIVLKMTHSDLDLWLSGANGYESVAMAYLHWSGWEWNECCVMLHAFPCIIRCRLEPSWDILDCRRGNTKQSGRTTVVGVRKYLIANALLYLQTR